MYEGKLYGKVEGSYFDIGKTSRDWDKLKSDLKDAKQEIKDLEDSYTLAYMAGHADGKANDIYYQALDEMLIVANIGTADKCKSVGDVETKINKLITWHLDNKKYFDDSKKAKCSTEALSEKYFVGTSCDEPLMIRFTLDEAIEFAWNLGRDFEHADSNGFARRAKKVEARYEQLKNEI